MLRPASRLDSFGTFVTGLQQNNLLPIRLQIKLTIILAGTFQPAG
jgi:hypothetical protein